jgi:hypothetical protein
MPSVWDDIPDQSEETPKASTSVWDDVPDVHPDMEQQVSNDLNEEANKPLYQRVYNAATAPIKATGEMLGQLSHQLPYGLTDATRQALSSNTPISDSLKLIPHTLFAAGMGELQKQGGANASQFLSNPSTAISNPIGPGMNLMTDWINKLIAPSIGNMPTKEDIQVESLKRGLQQRAGEAAQTEYGAAPSRELAESTVPAAQVAMTLAGLKSFNGVKEVPHTTSSIVGDSMLMEKGSGRPPVIKPPIEALDSSAKTNIKNAVGISNKAKAADVDHINRAVVEAHRNDPSSMSSFEDMKASNLQVQSKITEMQKQADKMGPQDTQRHIDAATEAASGSGKNLTDPEQATLDSVIEKFKKNPQMTASELNNYEMELNQRVKPTYGVKSDPFANKIINAVRDSVSNHVDELNTQAGVPNAIDLGKIKRGTHLLDDHIFKVQSKLADELRAKKPDLPAQVAFTMAAEALAHGHAAGGVIPAVAGISRILGNKKAAQLRDPLFHLSKLGHNLTKNIVIEDKLNNKFTPPPQVDPRVNILKTSSQFMEPIGRRPPAEVPPINIPENGMSLAQIKMALQMQPDLQLARPNTPYYPGPNLGGVMQEIGTR